MQFEKNWSAVCPVSSSYYNSFRYTTRNLLITLLSLKSFRHSFKNSVRCMYCHNLFDDQIELFEEIIIHLKKQSKFISTKKLIDILLSKNKIESNLLHLSFDDGFKNNFTNALPILIKHDIPAIFFVSTSYISCSWKMAKDFCLNRANYSGVIQFMDWEDLTEISNLGYEIGSHTKTHQRFSDISGDRCLMENEILGSKHILEEKLNKDCDYISWPYGKLDDSDYKSLGFVKETGYKACFGAFRGSVIPDKTNQYSIPRHHFEPHWPLSHINFFSQGGWE